MWCLSQGSDMMGLPSMNKRKLGGAEEEALSPAKQSRCDESSWNGVCGRPSRLEELASVAPPDWASRRPPLLTTLLEDDDDFEDDFEEEDDEDERYLSSSSKRSCRFSSEQAFEDQGYGSSGTSPARPSCPRSPYWGYNPCPPPVQQTIRREENGKSYLELGTSPHRTLGAVDKCCDASRTSWCQKAPETSCYRQRRLTVFNLSMCKLGRFRQFTDPSLLRSVLICNTLRYIEREMEQEGCFYNGSASCQAAPPPAPPPDINPSFPPPQFLQVPDLYESSGRATPYPMIAGANNDTDSGVGEEDTTRSINWGSVLSLSSQSDLDPINNNDLYSNTQDGRDFDDLLPLWKLTPISTADDILKTSTSDSLTTCAPQDVELMQVMVSS